MVLWNYIKLIYTKKSKKTRAGVVKMYQEEYKRWLAADLQDADLNPELANKNMK